jgi:hypothetical protein
VSNLPVTIFQFALSPYPNWQQLAWAGALLITATILGLSVLARFVIKKGRHPMISVQMPTNDQAAPCPARPRCRPRKRASRCATSISITAPSTP